VLPLATDQFFDTCKTDFLAKFDAAESALSDNPDFAIGFYDAKGSGGSKIDEKLQEMPSTASWLDNKVCQSSPSDGTTNLILRSL
jgi:hypothetical protein